MMRFWLFGCMLVSALLGVGCTSTTAPTEAPKAAIVSDNGFDSRAGCKGERRRCEEPKVASISVTTTQVHDLSARCIGADVTVIQTNIKSVKFVGNGQEEVIEPKTAVTGTHLPWPAGVYEWVAKAQRGATFGDKPSSGLLYVCMVPPA